MVHHKLYTSHSTQYMVHHTLYTSHSTQYTVHCMFLCCCFASQQHLRPYQDWYPLARVHTHDHWLYSAAPLGNQANNTMIWYPSQSHYPDTEPTSPCPILIMLSTWLGSYKYQFYKSLVWLDHGFAHTHAIPVLCRFGGAYWTHITQYTIHHTEHTVHHTEHTVHSMQYTVQNTHHTVLVIPYTVLNQQYTLPSKQCLLHITSCTRYTILSLTT